MPLSPPKSRTDLALAVMFVVAVMTVADVAATTLLGRNANSTFQHARPSPKPLPAPEADIPLAEAAGDEAQVAPQPTGVRCE